MNAVYFFVTFWPFSHLCDALMLSGYWVVFEFLGKFSLGHHCVLCASPGNEDRICGRRVDVLPWNHCHCERCGQPVVADQPVGVFCADCQSSTLLFDRARSPLRYAFPVDTALKALKFKRQLYVRTSIRRQSWCRPFTRYSRMLMHSYRSHCTA